MKALTHVISDKVSPPVTPSKPKKKNQQTPNRRKVVAVAKGNVSGVYDSRAKAEKEKQDVKPNSYAKFTSKKKVQEYEYVDNNISSNTTLGGRHRRRQKTSAKRGRQNGAR